MYRQSKIRCLLRALVANERQERGTTLLFSDAWSRHDNTVSKVQSVFPVDKMLSSPLTTSGKLTRLWFYSKYTLTCLVTKYISLKISWGFISLSIK